ncbi:MAG: ROK family protein [Clostridia bacterium]|nr:ROK family protein [Clostridia bacterium]
MKYCIGVDLGGTNTAVGLIDLDSKRIISKASTKTRAPRSAREIALDIRRLIHSLCDGEKIGMENLLWVGVATPGIVKNGVVVRATNLGWVNVPLAAIIGEVTSLPSFIANDANAAAYAEAQWGVGSGELSLIAVTLGTGVGGGIVIDGKIWEGVNGHAAEVGHMVVETDGRQCACGKRGCLETYCSVRALTAEAVRMMKRYPDSILASLAGGVPERMNGLIPFEAKRRGDAAGGLVVDEFISYLATGVANIINVFQPAVVCIGGGISGEGEDLIGPLRERLKRATFGSSGASTRVELAKYKNEAGIIGAGLLGLMNERTNKKSRVEMVVEGFRAVGDFISAEPYGSGHINDTRLVKTRDAEGKIHDYILQRINKNVFKRPDLLMGNYVAVTKFIREKIEREGGDPEREVINVIPTREGKDFLVDESGDFWRLLLFVSDSLSFDKVERPEQFYDSAVAFGNFQYMLRDFPAETLYETIPNFHNTPDRYRQLMEAVEKDAVGRLAEVGAEVEFARARREFTETLERAHAEGRLPLRVTHNDTKLNNILFDRETGGALCVIDLDTIMPGYSVNDFGDSIRFGATTALEDETDLTKVNFDISLYELYVKGFIEGAAGGLTAGELELLPIGAIMMTLECGMRFLTDYLSGDVYFRVHRPSHNLDRARNQFKLVADMESRLDEMKAIVRKYL